MRKKGIEINGINFINKREAYLYFNLLKNNVIFDKDVKINIIKKFNYLGMEIPPLSVKIDYILFRERKSLKDAFCLIHFSDRKSKLEINMLKFYMKTLQNEIPVIINPDREEIDKIIECLAL